MLKYLSVSCNSPCVEGLSLSTTICLLDGVFEVHSLKLLLIEIFIERTRRATECDTFMLFTVLGKYSENSFDSHRILHRCGCV
jgi:hypothetical protein